MTLTKEEIVKIEEEERVRAEIKSKIEEEKKENKTSPLTWISAIIIVFIVIFFILPSPFGMPFLLLSSPILYLYPSIIALKRKKKDLWKIIAINVFLGWTLIGWGVALTNAYSD